MTTESSTPVGLAVGAIVLLVGPDAGQHAAIIIGGMAGVMHSLGRAHTQTKLDGALFVARWLLTAAILTGFVSWVLQQHAGIPAERWPGAVAFAITFLADRWPSIIGSVWGAFMSAKTGAKEPHA